MPGDAARRHDSALASPLSSPPKQPPTAVAPFYPRAVSSPLLSLAFTPFIRRHRRHHRDGVPLVPPFASFQPTTAPRSPIAPRSKPSCLGPTNAILIGRKGGIQECKDLPRAPRGERPPSPRLWLFSVFSAFLSRLFQLLLRRHHSTGLFFRGALFG